MSVTEMVVHGNSTTGDTITFGMSTSGTTTTVNWGNYCYVCSCSPCSCHYHYFPSYTIPSPDKAALLKAWLDGYTTDRKMTEKALKRIKQKIEQFCR